MAIQNRIVGKLVTILLTGIGFSEISCAQTFDQQFYFEWGTNGSDFTLANLFQLSDSLASIEFRSSDPNNRAYFACNYLFRNDSLLVTEISENSKARKELESGSVHFLRMGNDSIYLRFDSYQSFDSKLPYDTVFFEINGKYYYKSERCYSDYCAIAFRPKEREFQVKVWSGKELIDTYDVELNFVENWVCMKRWFFDSSKVFQPMSFYESKFPTHIEYQGKMYALKVSLQSKQFHETKFAVEK